VPLNRWAQERERAFSAWLQRNGASGEIHRGLATSAPGQSGQPGTSTDIV